MNNNGSYNLSFPQNAKNIVNNNGGSTMNVSKSIMQNLSRAALALAVCLLTLTSAFALTNEQHVPKLNNLGKKLFDGAASFQPIFIDS